MDVKLAREAIKEMILRFCEEHKIEVETFHKKHLSFPQIDKDLDFNEKNYDHCYWFIKGYVLGRADNDCSF